MAVVIERIGPGDLAAYGQVPLVCDVRSRVSMEGLTAGVGRVVLKEEPIDVPYVKDYDAFEEGRPGNWGKLFDLSNWGLWAAREDGEMIGGAAVAWKTPEVGLTPGRESVAALWDLRVRASHRRRGVATALVGEAAGWARSKGCRRLMVETQNVNVAACRFYAGVGFELNAVEREAYRRQAEIAHEVMLVWCLRL